MERSKNTGHPPQRPGGSWPGGSWPGGSWPGSSCLAGMVIGVAIMTMATQAAVLGAGAALKDVTWKGG